ncbi:hypothetical protein VCHC50A2_1861A, partial [Vibrio cholerae HC-50A2]
MRIRQWKG